MCFQVMQRAQRQSGRIFIVDLGGVKRFAIGLYLSPGEGRVLKWCIIRMGGTAPGLQVLVCQCGEPEPVQGGQAKSSVGCNVQSWSCQEVEPHTSWVQVGYLSGKGDLDRTGPKWSRADWTGLEWRGQQGATQTGQGHLGTWS